MQDASAPETSRRGLLQAAGALGLMAGAPSLAMARARGPLDFTRPEDNLYGLLKLMGDLSGRRTYVVQPGRIYAFRPGGAATPILTYTGLTVREIRRVSAGEYHSRYAGWMLMRDPVTGAVLDEWTNPISGKRNKVDHFVTAIGRQGFSASGLKRPAGYNGTFTWFDKPFVLPWQVIGDDAWAPYEQFSTYRDRAGNERYETAIHTYHGRLGRLADPRLSSAPSTIASQSQSPFYPWMELASDPGHLILHSLGKKLAGRRDIPARLEQEIESRFPGAIDRPFDWTGA